MSIVVKAESPDTDLVEDGVYPAKLTAIKQFENAYGPRLGFEFTLGGTAAGQTVMRSTTPKLTAKSKLADLIQGITGELLSPEEVYSGVDLETLIGKPCQVLVRQSRSKNGKVYSNIEQVFGAGTI